MAEAASRSLHSTRRILLLATTLLDGGEDVFLLAHIQATLSPRVLKIERSEVVP